MRARVHTHTMQLCMTNEKSKWNFADLFKNLVFSNTLKETNCDMRPKANFASEALELRAISGCMYMLINACKLLRKILTQDVSLPTCRRWNNLWFHDYPAICDAASCFYKSLKCEFLYNSFVRMFSGCYGERNYRGGEKELPQCRQGRCQGRP